MDPGTPKLLLAYMVQVIASAVMVIWHFLFALMWNKFSLSFDQNQYFGIK